MILERSPISFSALRISLNPNPFYSILFLITILIKWLTCSEPSVILYYLDSPFSLAFSGPYDMVHILCFQHCFPPALLNDSFTPAHLNQLLPLIHTEIASSLFVHAFSLLESFSLSLMRSSFLRHMQVISHLLWISQTIHNIFAICFILYFLI